MDFVGINGKNNKESSYVSLNISNGDNNNCIGDQVWISSCGKLMEVSEMADSEVLVETMKLFNIGSRRAFRGAMLRMGVEF